MIHIENDNSITLIKGNTAYLSVQFNDKYKYKEGDTLTLTIRATVDSESELLSKTIAANSKFTFEPSDTANITAGRYLYDVRLDTVYDEKFTVVPPSTFTLREGITRG